MANIICHNDGRYNIYTTISDGFRFVESLDLNQLKIYIRNRYGSEGVKNLPERLDRAHKNGHSRVPGGKLEDLLRLNRAGKNEKRLSFTECIKQFLS